MIARLLLVVAMLGGPMPVSRAQDGSVIGVLPATLRSEPLDEAERNPFVRKEEPKPEVETIVEDTQSEESLITTALQGLEVVGRTRGDRGWKVLLGDMILEEGRTLPPVIQGQTQTLRVAAVYDSMVEIEWIEPESSEAESSEATRRIFIPIDLEPKVNIAISGAGADPEKPAAPTIITPPPKAGPPNASAPTR